MNLIVIPPASVAKPHLHKGYETAIYLLKGRVETRYGHNLERSIVSQEADLILIKPDVPHQPVNLDPKEAALAIVHATIPTSRRALCTTARRTDRRSSARFQFPELRTSQDYSSNPLVNNNGARYVSASCSSTFFGRQVCINPLSFFLQLLKRDPGRR